MKNMFAAKQIPIFRRLNICLSASVRRTRTCALDRLERIEKVLQYIKRGRNTAQN